METILSIGQIIVVILIIANIILGIVIYKLKKRQEELQKQNRILMHEGLTRRGKID